MGILFSISWKFIFSFGVFHFSFFCCVPPNGAPPTASPGPSDPVVLDVKMDVKKGTIELFRDFSRFQDDGPPSLMALCLAFLE